MAEGFSEERRDYDAYMQAETDRAWDILFYSQSDTYDPIAHDLYVEGVHMKDSQAYDDLIEYMDWHYGIDIEEIIDYNDGSPTG